MIHFHFLAGNSVPPTGCSTDLRSNIQPHPAGRCDQFHHLVAKLYLNISFQILLQILGVVSNHINVIFRCLHTFGQEECCINGNLFSFLEKCSFCLEIRTKRLMHLENFSQNLYFSKLVSYYYCFTPFCSSLTLLICFKKIQKTVPRAPLSLCGTFTFHFFHQLQECT